MKRGLITLSLMVASFAGGSTAADRLMYSASTRAAAVQRYVEASQHAELERMRTQFIRGDEAIRDEMKHNLWHAQYRMADRMRNRVDDYLKLRAGE